MTTAPSSTDSAALPTPVAAAQLVSSAPQNVPPVLTEPAIKQQAAPVKRTRKTTPKPAAAAAALLQPAVKQTTARKTPARPAPAPLARVQTVAPKLVKSRAIPASAVPADAAPERSVPAKSPAQNAILAKATAPAGVVRNSVAVKAKKEKLVRDSFTIPKSEFAVLDQLKRRAGIMARSVKKSELLRAGIKLLASLSNEALMAALSQVPTIKTGRPALKK